MAHEGSHVEDDMNFLWSYNASNGTYNATLNFTHFATEYAGFQTGAIVKPYSFFQPGPHSYAPLEDYIFKNYRDPLSLEFPTSLYPQEWPQ